MMRVSGGGLFVCLFVWRDGAHGRSARRGTDQGREARDVMIDAHNTTAVLPCTTVFHYD